MNLQLQLQHQWLNRLLLLHLKLTTKLKTEPVTVALVLLCSKIDILKFSVWIMCSLYFPSGVVFISGLFLSSAPTTASASSLVTVLSPPSFSAASYTIIQNLTHTN
uniref:Uncharacterized protein n=1 Tax=Noccaea caerulescens TaxID=107243 RepID=A0A1J3H081_NOCCA